MFLSTPLPPLADGLQTSFRSYLTTELGAAVSHLHAPVSAPRSSGFLGDIPILRHDAESLLHMISNGASERQIADSLLFSLNQGWVQEKRNRYGESSVTVEEYGAERLFQPFSKDAEQMPTVGRRVDSKAVCEDLKHYYRGNDESFESRVANKVLEIRCRREIFDLISVFMVHVDLVQYGFYLFHHEGDDQTVVRIPSFTLLEAAVKFCLGDQALASCYVPGQILAEKLNLLHKMGFHAVGMPLKETPMHGRQAHPAEWPWHDQYHRIHASLYIPLWEQRASAVFFEALANRKRKYSFAIRVTEEDLRQIVDLDFRDHEMSYLPNIVGRFLQNVREAYGSNEAEEFVPYYLEQLERHVKERKTRGHRIWEMPEYRAFQESVRKMAVQKKPFGF